MGVMQKDANAANSKRARSRKTSSEKTPEQIGMAADVGDQDEQLWECAIDNSIDALRDLADKALADRRAGRTKKITL